MSELKLTDKQKQIFLWTSRVLALLALLVGAVAGFGFLPGSIVQYAAAIAALLGIGSRWCEQQLPAQKKAETQKPDLVDPK